MVENLVFYNIHRTLQLEVIHVAYRENSDHIYAKIAEPEPDYAKFPLPLGRGYRKRE